MAFFVFFAEAAGLRDQINEGVPLTTFAQDSRAGRRTSPAIQRRRETSGAASILLCPFAEQLRPPTGSLSVRYLSCKGEYTTHMAEKLKIIPLGGLNEIGKNMTAYEQPLIRGGLAQKPYGHHEHDEAGQEHGTSAEQVRTVAEGYAQHRSQHHGNGVTRAIWSGGI